MSSKIKKKRKFAAVKRLVKATDARLHVREGERAQAERKRPRTNVRAQPPPLLATLPTLHTTLRTESPPLRRHCARAGVPKLRPRRL